MRREEVYGQATLVSRLKEALAGSESPIVIQAGHFALDWLDGQASDRLEPTDGALGQRFGAFCSESWGVGMALVRCLDEGGREGSLLMTLVNDWQFLRPMAHRNLKGDRRREFERQAALARNRYYHTTSRLPQALLKRLGDAGLTSERIFKSSASRWLFSETELREGLAKTLMRERRDGRLGELGVLEETLPGGGTAIRARSTLDQEVCLLYCGSANCAGEVVELLRVLYGRGIRSFVNIFPTECESPVAAGTTIGLDMFKLMDFRIVNVAMTVEGGEVAARLYEYHGPEY